MSSQQNPTTIVCTMCKKQERPIAPEVAAQVETQLLAEFSVPTGHLNKAEYSEGCFRLLMLTYRITAKLRRKQEAAQESRAKIEYKPIVTAEKRGAPKEGETEERSAKRVRLEEEKPNVEEKRKEMAPAKKIRQAEVPMEVEEKRREILVQRAMRMRQEEDWRKMEKKRKEEHRERSSVQMGGKKRIAHTSRTFDEKKAANKENSSNYPLFL